MEVFISFSEPDKAFAAKLQDALAQRNIGVWSALDLPQGEDWIEAVNRASAKADAFIFLLRPQTVSDPHMLTEWRNMLRNDWESKKIKIPILTSKRPLKKPLPGFIRNLRFVPSAKFDEVVERVVYLLQHPAETRDRRLDEKGIREHARRLEEIRAFALALEQYNKSEAQQR